MPYRLRMRFGSSAEKSLRRIFPLCRRELDAIHQEIIQEIATGMAESCRGITRERAVKRKIKGWNIKQDFSSKAALYEYIII